MTPEALYIRLREEEKISKEKHLIAEDEREAADQLVKRGLGFYHTTKAYISLYRDVYEP